MKRLGVLLFVVLCACAAIPSMARAEVVWLCHPSLSVAEDPCKSPLDTTRVAADDSRTKFTPKRIAQARRAVDCFYVYPTVSNQPGPNATQAKDPEVRAVAKFQVARYQTGCRMFAPVYKQVTVASIAGNGVPATAEVAYEGVREAFLRYLKKDNGGRGFILLGHSQGTLMLRQLIRTEIDSEARAAQAPRRRGDPRRQRHHEAGGDDRRRLPARPALHEAR